MKTGRAGHSPSCSNRWRPIRVGQAHPASPTRNSEMGARPAHGRLDDLVQPAEPDLQRHLDVAHRHWVDVVQDDPEAGIRVMRPSFVVSGTNSKAIDAGRCVQRGFAPVDSFEEIAELGRRDLHCLAAPARLHQRYTPSSDKVCYGKTAIAPDGPRMPDRAQNRYDLRRQSSGSAQGRRDALSDTPFGHGRHLSNTAGLFLNPAHRRPRAVRCRPLPDRTRSGPRSEPSAPCRDSPSGAPPRAGCRPIGSPSRVSPRRPP